VYLKFDKNYVASENLVEAYVYLKNKIFVNAYLIKSGLATVDVNSDFDLKSRFMKIESDYRNNIQLSLIVQDKTKSTE